MKNSFFYLFCFFFPFVGIAQLQQISKTHFGDAKDNDAETISTLSNGYTLIGYNRYIERGANWKEDYPQGALILFDEKGKIKWEKNYNAFGVKIIRSLVVAPNQKEFTVTGGYYDSQKKLEGFVLRLDSLGNVLWHKEYPEYISKIVEDREGNFFCSIGVIDTLRIMKLDAQGSVLWIKVCTDGNYRNEFPTLCMSNDKAFLYVVYNGTSNINPFSNPKLNDVWVKKYDLSGEILWETRVGTSFHEAAPQLKEIENEQVLIACDQYEKALYTRDIALYLLDKNGVVQKERQIRGNKEEILDDVLGQVGDHLFFSFSSNSDEKDFYKPIKEDYIYFSYIYKLDLDLNTVSTCSIKDELFQLFSKIAFNPFTKGIDATAWSTDSLLRGNGYLYKFIDLEHYFFGCMTEATLYPNPINSTDGQLNLRLPDIYYSKQTRFRLHDSNGRLVYATQQQIVGNEINFSIPLSLQPGLYFLEINCDNGARLIKKVVVSK
jgi:hypothetical protein